MSQLVILALPKKSLRKGQNLGKIRGHAELRQGGYFIFLWKRHIMPRLTSANGEWVSGKGNAGGGGFVGRKSRAHVQHCLEPLEGLGRAG